MKVNNIIKNLKIIQIQGDLEKEVTNISYDSRDVKPNGLFVAIKGFKIDGHAFIDKAITKGAIVIIAESNITDLPQDITFIKVVDTRLALSKVAANFFDNPTTKVKLIAITGTNGKTSTSYIISQILQSFGLRIGVIGTSGIRINGTPLTSVNKTTPTTPESLDIQTAIHLMLKEGVEVVVMEASSMALKLNRLADCDIDIAIYTNLSREHLDDHGTFADYMNSKSILFKLSKDAIINIDDDYSATMLKVAQKATTYGINEKSDIKILNIQLNQGGSEFEIINKKSKVKCSLPIPGMFSIYNSVAAMGACLKLGFSIDLVSASIKSLKPVEGRIESVANEFIYNIIIDYAHTPNALRNVLDTLKPVTKNKLIVVFGCGGNRDKTKRSEMGKIASSIADYIIITNDNPRHENPIDIANEIITGISKKEFEIILDRKDAINRALSLAVEGDTVLIAGKGSEEYQIIGDIKNPFNDKLIVKEYLKNLN